MHIRNYNWGVWILFDRQVSIWTSDTKFRCNSWSSFGELSRNRHNFPIVRSFYSPHSNWNKMTVRCNGCCVISFTTTEVSLEYRNMKDS
jgi:hypothetical protein